MTTLMAVQRIAIVMLAAGSASALANLDGNLTPQEAAFAQQGAPPLQVISPAPGAVVEPGGVVRVVVRVAQANRFDAVTAVLQDGTLEGRPLTGGGQQDLEFFLQADNRRLGPSKVSAWAIRKPRNPGQEADSAFAEPVPIKIETERAVTALEISAPRSLHFDFPGDQYPLTVTGIFEDGSRMVIQDSSRVNFSEAAEQVAFVRPGGVVVAFGGGSTTITVTYGGKSLQIPVTVPVTIPGDLDGDKDVDEDDLNVIRAAIQVQQAPTGPFDARDVNKNGTITDADVEALRALCTRPNCATF